MEVKRCITKIDNPYKKKPKRGITSNLENDEWDRAILEVIRARDEDSERYELPKLNKARELLCKAIRQGKASRDDLTHEKETKDYHLGGFKIVLTAANDEVAKIVQPAGLQVNVRCASCNKAPCALKGKYRNDNKTLEEVLSEMDQKGLEDGVPWDYVRARCQIAAMSVLSLKGQVKCLPDCVIDAIEAFRYSRFPYSHEPLSP